MKAITKLAMGTALSFLSIVAIASPSIVGKWKSKVEVDWSKAPGKVTPDQKEKLLKQLNSHLLVFDFRANKTLTVTEGHTGSQNGTWTEAGSIVEINLPKTQKKTTFTLARDGKTMLTPMKGASFKIILIKI